MSVIFGILRSSGMQVADAEMLELAGATERFASSPGTMVTVGRIGMGLQSYPAQSLTEREKEPTQDSYGNLLVLDGRIDNFCNLCRELTLPEAGTSDTELVLKAYRRWGSSCFSRVVGDWALALWSSTQERLYLARDHAGTRTLYYRRLRDAWIWSTHLEGIAISPEALDLDDEYAACFLAGDPIRDRTPYKQVRAVLPAHYLTIDRESTSLTAHWEWMRGSRLDYCSREEYCQHFYSLLSQSVERRDRPEEPVIAELSGGMDSTTIVCISDRLRKKSGRATELVETVSFYDDSEPHWDESPYFKEVEAQRGKTGVHIDTSFAHRTFEPHDGSRGVYMIPGVDSSAIEHEEKLIAAFGNQCHVVLSGIGGDELLGGVADPRSELGDLMTQRNIRALLERTLAWSLRDRTPILFMLAGTARYVHTLYRRGPTIDRPVAPWLTTGLQRLVRALRESDPIVTHSREFQPSSLSNGIAWWSIMETLPHCYPGILWRPEYRYPYLDKDLVEFLFAVPPEQLMAPGRRRSLMRQALRGVLPEKVLERRRKAYQVRGPLIAIQESRSKIDQLFAFPLLAEMSFIDTGRFREALELTSRGRDIRWWQSLFKSISFELWLRSLASTRQSAHRKENTYRPVHVSCGANKIRTLRVAS